MGEYDKYKESAFTHEEMQPMIIETDMTDIVERLRKNTVCMGHGDYSVDPLCEEAADEIERLRKREEILSGWLNGALDVVERFTVADTKNARAALGEKE